jgi:heme exporter protein D
MDWPIASPGWDVQVAWVDRASMLGWGVLIWAGVAATLAVLLLPIASRAVRRRRFWCARAQREVEVEFEEHGLIGFRRAVAVRSCSVFDPPMHVHCRRSCLDQDARARLAMTLARPWRRP